LCSRLVAKPSCGHRLVRDGSGIASFLMCARSRGEALLRRMFTESRLFRLIIGEVENLPVDLNNRPQYAGLLPTWLSAMPSLPYDRARVQR
jgi:hypothetical protein